MKKILFILLLPTLLYSQIEFLGTVTIQDTIKYDNTEVLSLLKQLPENIQTKDKTEVIFLPVYKIYNKTPRLLMLFDGIYFAQFTYDSNTKVVTLEQVETWLISYNLRTKTFSKPTKYLNDTYDVFRPDNLNQKIRDKMKVSVKP